jgi:hypothetical protein
METQVLSASSLSNRLTLVLTTSPVPTAPSTELLSSVLESVAENCPVLLQCNVIVVFDNYDRITEHARLKKGCVTADGALSFARYKENVKLLVLQTFGHNHDSQMERNTTEVEFGSPFKEENSIPCFVSATADEHVIFVEPQTRIGFSLAVRTALRLTTTPYVWIHQHDWNVVAPIPIMTLLDIMMAYDDHEISPIKYICLPSIRILKYAEQSDNIKFESFRTLTRELKQGFRSNSRDAQHDEISLTPLFFWYDKPHIASTSHYLQRVFPSRHATKRGTFIEDTIGHTARTQIKEDAANWRKWATWLYYPGGGKNLCLRHLEGRTWKGKDGEEESVETWKRINREEAVKNTMAPDIQSSKVGTKSSP